MQYAFDILKKNKIVETFGEEEKYIFPMNQVFFCELNDI